MSETTVKNSQSREYFIHGVTADGRPFRPSDWAERLAGVLSCYRPGGVRTGRDAFIGYSPYVRPVVIGGIRCVVVDERLKELEVMAFEFVLNFAQDNGLPVLEGCSIPETPGVERGTGSATGTAVDSSVDLPA